MAWEPVGQGMHGETGLRTASVMLQCHVADQCVYDIWGYVEKGVHEMPDTLGGLGSSLSPISLFRGGAGSYYPAGAQHGNLHWVAARPLPPCPGAGSKQRLLEFTHALKTAHPKPACLRMHSCTAPLHPCIIGS